MNILFQYYCDKSRFGKPLPQPRIKHTKMAGKGYLACLACLHPDPNVKCHRREIPSATMGRLQFWGGGVA